MLLGRKAIKHSSLTSSRGHFTGYNKNTSPNFKKASSSAAGRYGHTLVNKYHYVYNNKYLLVYKYTKNNVVHSHTYYSEYNLRGNKNKKNNQIRKETVKFIKIKSRLKNKEVQLKKNPNFESAKPFHYSTL